jgi:hypothetical protein
LWWWCGWRWLSVNREGSHGILPRPGAHNAFPVESLKAI